MKIIQNRKLVFNMAKRLRYSNGLDIEKRCDDYITKCQQICKFFREEVVQVSLKTMGETFEILPATLSAWENGKSKNADFIFYYYDIVVEPDYKKEFLRLIFDCSDKAIKVTALKQLRDDIAKGFYACVGLDIQEMEQTEFNKGVMWLTTQMVI